MLQNRAKIMETPLYKQITMVSALLSKINAPKGIAETRFLYKLNNARALRMRSTIAIMMIVRYDNRKQL